jgi:hypothetical protein
MRAVLDYHCYACGRTSSLYGGFCDCGTALLFRLDNAYLRAENREIAEYLKRLEAYRG